MHGTLLAMVQANLTQAKLPMKLWGEALRYSVHIHNHTPRAAIGFDTPYNKRHNKAYIFRDLHMFGQHVIVHDPNASKIEPRGNPGQYLAPDEHSLGHRIWINNKLCAERNVQFLDSTHPKIAGEYNRHDVKCEQSSPNNHRVDYEYTDIIPREQWKRTLTKCA